MYVADLAHSVCSASPQVAPKFYVVDLVPKYACSLVVSPADLTFQGDNQHIQAHAPLWVCPPIHVGYRGSLSEECLRMHNIHVSTKRGNALVNVCERTSLQQQTGCLRSVT